MTHQIDTTFPGGNGIIDRIDGPDIHFHPDLRDTEGHWFYWCLRLRGVAGRALRFHLTSPNTLTAMGPAVSLDAGQTWSWLGPGQLDGDESFRFSCPPDADEVRLSMGMPYTRTHWDAFLVRHRDSPHLQIDSLGQSRQGRGVDRLLVGCIHSKPTYRVMLTARHHCCEMMASYALEGLLDSVLKNDDLGRWLQQHVQFLAIPFVDPDGVEAGDQGKNRRPRDHNRDYSGEPIHPETAAIRRFVPAWADGRLDVAIDLHCPWIRSEQNHIIYLVGSSDPAIWRQQGLFGGCLEQLQRGPLPYAQADNLPYGQRWNVASNSAQGWTCTRWAAALSGVTLSTSIELPYALAKGREVNADSARAFGRDLALALRAYLNLRDRTV